MWGTLPRGGKRVRKITAGERLPQPFAAKEDFPNLARAEISQQDSILRELLG